MYKIIVIVLVTLFFIFNLFVDILKYKSRNTKIPEEIADVYDENRYKTYKEYKAEQIKLGIIREIASYVITIAIFLSNVFAYLFGNVENIRNSTIFVLLTYTGLNFIIDVIFDYYRNMVIEEKYGFNKTKMKTFIGDEIRGLILEIIILIGLTLCFISLYQSMGDYVLLLFSGIVFAFSLFISFIYPYVSRIANKFTPLEEGELRTKLKDLLESHKYHVRDIFVMDASKRTTKSNAYFAGFGKSKTIVLYDNLLKQESTDEIVAIFAHEMGHGIHKDTFKQSVLRLLSIIAMVVLAWALVKVPALYQDFGFDSINYGFGVLILMNAIIPFVMTLFNILSSYVSRKCEYRADKQAVIEGYGEYLISALKVLNREDLGDLTPHPLIVFLYYSHPTLLQRIHYIRECEKKKEENNE